MKRFLAVLLILVCITGFSAAEESLKNLSIDQLRKMIQMINAEIVSRPEWKEATVPGGEWVVGVDIPAGTYSITPVSSSSLILIWRKAIDNYSNNGLVFNQNVKQKDPIGRIVLEAGWIFTNSNAVIFTPPVSLGF